MEHRKRARRIAIVSGKGGVGKTIITANVAASLALFGRKILVIDADLGLANLDIILGVEPKLTIFDALRGGKPLDEIICPTMKGFDLIPAGSSVPEGTIFSEGLARNLEEVVTSLQDRYDVILFDAGAGIGDVVLFFAGIADELLVVATPDPTSVMDAYATIKVLNQLHGKNDFHMIINQANPENAVQVGETITNHLRTVAARYLQSENPIRIELAGSIPLDPLIPRAVRKRQLLVETSPAAPSSYLMNHLANYLDTRLSL